MSNNTEKTSCHCCILYLKYFIFFITNKKSLLVQDGVAEDAALMQSDPLPVTDAHPMEGDG
jgi:hypothetical protein